MRRSRTWPLVVAVAGIGASGVAGAFAAQFVTDSMTSFYSSMVTPSLPSSRMQTTDAQASSSTVDTYATAPVSYWQHDENTAERILPTDDDAKWERQAEATERRRQARFDAELRAADQRAAQLEPTPEAGEKPSTPPPESGKGPPVTTIPDDAGQPSLA